MLQFPSDIDSDPGVGNHGHYIIFYINEFEIGNDAKVEIKNGGDFDVVVQSSLLQKLLNVMLSPAALGTPPKNII